jgi:hypothetical protein
LLTTVLTSGQSVLSQAVRGSPPVSSAARNDVGRDSARARRTEAIQVLRAYPISVDNASRPHFESHLAVDPRDPQHLLATSMVQQGERYRSYIYVTFDGGRRWTRATTQSGDTSLFTGLDPVVYFSRTGTAFFATGAQSRTLFSRSTDGGRSWGDPIRLSYRDREYIAVDTTGGPLDGTIYVAGSMGPIIWSRSTDDGQTLTAGDLIARDEGGANPEMPIRAGLADVLVTPDGVLVMPFSGRVDMRDSIGFLKGDTAPTAMLRVLVSDNGGRTFAAMRPGPLRYSDPVLTGYRTRQAKGTLRASIDGSRSLYRGRLYLVWPNYENGRYVARLARSSNLGKTWASTAVSSNPAEYDVSNAAVTVNKDGVVAVVWNDRRDDPDGKCFRLYGAISTDGGESFQPEVKLRDSAACPNASANWTLTTWYQYDYWTDPTQKLPGFGLTAFVPVRFPNGGETQGLAADRDGTFHVSYIDGRSGVMQLWYLAFTADPELVTQLRTRSTRQAGGMSTPPPRGREDVSQEMTFDMSDPKIDFATGTLTVSMSVVNPTSRAVHGPLDVVLARLTGISGSVMGLANVRATNADNGAPGTGATWSFSVGPTGILAAGGRTERRTLRFAFDSGVPAAPAGYFEPVFRVYAWSATSDTPSRVVP